MLSVQVEAMPITTAAGPLLHATLVVDDTERLLVAYAALGLVAVAQAPVSAAQAHEWQQPQLAARRCMLLASAGGTTLLRIIEVPGTPLRPTRFSHGWLALEILVRDVDALAEPARRGGFEIVGAPADLDVSPHIRAMQLVGPAGEMLYLTQVKAPVPPFDLPLSSALASHIGPLFIVVMSVPSRAAALAACAPLLPISTLQFDTKVTVLNRAFGRALVARWPVATVQLAGQCLFEIDEVVDARVVAPASDPLSALPAGLAWVTLRGGAGAKLQELSPGAWLECSS